jgi:colanic acid/amylovoran biosynthesis protein
MTLILGTIVARTERDERHRRLDSRAAGDVGDAAICSAAVMRILIDSGSYHALNVGDIAMLQSAVERLRTLWPSAAIAAVMNPARTLEIYCPGVQAVPLVGRELFLGDRFLGRAHHFVPGALRDGLVRLHDRLRREWPGGLSSLIAVKRALALRPDYSAPRAYVRALQQADVVIASGAGIFTDPFVENAMDVLATLEEAQRLNKITAIMGHGIGPLTNEALRQRLTRVLPRVDLIALREYRESVRVLTSLGVPTDRIAVTGDDALEMAQRQTPRELGGGIGINVRVAGYAGVSSGDVDVVRPAVRRASMHLAAPLVPVAIAHHPNCHDGVAIRDLLAESGDAGQPVPETNTPAHAIEAVSRCRVVVTGSYHAAVFALAQGIPAVGLAAAPYYVHKFGGLAELFPGGCETVALGESEAGATLERAIVAAWTNAPGRRDQLLRDGRAQIDAGRAAYRRLGQLVSHRLGLDPWTDRPAS